MDAIALGTMEASGEAPCGCPYTKETSWTMAGPREGTGVKHGEDCSVQATRSKAVALSIKGMVERTERKAQVRAILDQADPRKLAQLLGVKL